MKDMRYTELFYSLQGEGLRVGVPSVFFRMFGCNFECKGFSNPEMKDPNVIPAINLLSINEADLELGCDSRYSWHKDYRNLAIKAAPHEVANTLIDFTKEKHRAAVARWPKRNRAGNVVRLIPGQTTSELLQIATMAHVPDWVFTGGEPFMQQEQLEALLRHTMYVVDEEQVEFGGNGLPMLTFETNASIKMRDSMVSCLREYNDNFGDLHFSNSPKLSFTGEHRSAALKPEVIGQQEQTGGSSSFKFVVRPAREDFDELMEFMQEYMSYTGSGNLEGIYVMPVGASLHQQQAIATQVAELALEYGLSYSPRLQCDLWANKIGT
ncbi:QueE-like radical SAM domain [Pseudomonas phage vB_PpuM-Illi-2]